MGNNRKLIFFKVPVLVSDKYTVFNFIHLIKRKMHSREVKGNQNRSGEHWSPNIKVQSPTKLEPTELEKTETNNLP